MESSYNNWVVDDVVILEYPNEPSTEFVVTVEQGKKVDLYFSEGGGCCTKRCYQRYEHTLAQDLKVECAARGM